MGRVAARGGAWRQLEARDTEPKLLAARERSDEDKISQKGRSERFLSDGAKCGLIEEAEAEVAASSGF